MIIATSSRLEQIHEYYFSRKLREIAEMVRNGKPVINLGIGSPDLPPSKEVIQELSDMAEHDLHHSYQSYIGIPAMREAMAAWYQRFYGVKLNPEGEILPLMGSKEGIMHIAMTFLGPGDRALVPNPGYPTYRSAVTLAGAEVIEYDLDAKRHWLPDLNALEKKDLSNVKIMWVNYPHMPTGAHANVTFYTQLIAFAKKHKILIVNDNPYSFILNEHPLSLLSAPGAGDVALELNSLSKSHNMAGWRVGMLCGRSDYIQQVLRFKSNMDSGMFLPVQKAAIRALNQEDAWYAQLNHIYRARQQKVFEMLSLIRCTFDSDQQGMFVWAKVPAVDGDGFALSDKILHAANVFITPGGIFGSNGKQYIRISLCTDVKIFDEAILRIKVLNH